MQTSKLHGRKENNTKYHTVRLNELLSNYCCLKLVFCNQNQEQICPPSQTLSVVTSSQSSSCSSIPVIIIIIICHLLWSAIGHGFLFIFLGSPNRSTARNNADKCSRTCRYDLIDSVKELAVPLDS